MSPGREVQRVFMIADLSGYTALTAAHGNVEAAKVVTRYVELARDALAPGAHIVERVGDELVIVSEGVGDALRTALRLRGAIEAEPLFPAVRIGVHVGTVLEQDGQLYGAGLNVAARVAAFARPGQILCTDAVAADAGRVGLECRPLGEVRFKNVPAATAVFEVAGPSGTEVVRTVDPVCRMQVDTEHASGRLTWRGATYFFCSLDCARAFALRPEDYVPVTPAGA